MTTRRAAPALLQVQTAAQPALYWLFATQSYAPPTLQQAQRAPPPSPINAGRQKAHPSVPPPGGSGGCWTIPIASSRARRWASPQPRSTAPRPAGPGGQYEGQGTSTHATHASRAPRSATKQRSAAGLPAPLKAPHVVLQLAQRARIEQGLVQVKDERQPLRLEDVDHKVGGGKADPIAQKDGRCRAIGANACAAGRGSAAPHGVCMCSAATAGQLRQGRGLPVYRQRSVACGAARNLNFSKNSRTLQRHQQVLEFARPRAEHHRHAPVRYVGCVSLQEPAGCEHAYTPACSTARALRLAPNCGRGGRARPRTGGTRQARAGGTGLQAGTKQFNQYPPLGRLGLGLEDKGGAWGQGGQHAW